MGRNQIVFNHGDFKLSKLNLKTDMIMFSPSSNFNIVLSLIDNHSSLLFGEYNLLLKTYYYKGMDYVLNNFQYYNNKL